MERLVQLQSVEHHQDLVRVSAANVERCGDVGTGRAGQLLHGSVEVVGQMWDQPDLFRSESLSRLGLLGDDSRVARGDDDLLEKHRLRRSRNDEQQPAGPFANLQRVRF